MRHDTYTIRITQGSARILSDIATEKCREILDTIDRVGAKLPAQAMEHLLQLARDMDSASGDLRAQAETNDFRERAGHPEAEGSKP